MANLLDKALGQAKNIATSPVVNNPVTDFLFGGAKNVANDIGAGIQAKIASPAMNNQNAQLDQRASIYENQAQNTHDPHEKAYLLSQANIIRNSISQNASQVASTFSPEVQQNPLLRSLGAATQIVTGGDVAAHPIQTVQGAYNVARHPLQTLEGAGNLIAHPLQSVLALKDQGQLDAGLAKGNNSIKLGNRFLLGQYKNPDAFSHDPLSVVSQLKSKYNLSNPQDIADAASTVTGSADNPSPIAAIVHKKVISAIKDADPVDTTGIVQKATDNMQNLTNISGKQEQKALNFVKKGIMNASGADITANNGLLNSELRKTGNNALASADPQKVFEFTRALDQQAATAGKAAYDHSGNLTDATQNELSHYYKDVSSELKARLFGGITSDPNVLRVGADSMRLPASWTPEEISALHNIHPNLAKDITSQENVGGLRKIESLFVQGSKMATKGNLDLAEKTPSLTTMGAGIATVLNPNPVSAGLFLSSTNKGRNILGNLLNKAGDVGIGAKATTGPVDAGAQGLLKTLGYNPQNQSANGNSPYPWISSQGNNEQTHSSSVADSGTNVNRYVAQNDPIASGQIMNTQDYLAKDNAITQQIAQASANGDKVTAQKLAGDQAALQNTYAGQKALRDAWTNGNNGTSNVLTVGNKSFQAIQKADPSFFNALNGGYDKLLNSTNANYAKMGGYLKYISNATGVDFTQYKTKEALIGALDAAMQNAQTQWSTQQQLYTGNTSGKPRPTQATTAAPSQAQPQFAPGGFGSTGDMPDDFGHPLVNQILQGQ